MRNQDPEAASAQLMALAKLLEIQGGDIYSYIPKADYDAIIAKQPSDAQKQMQQEQMQQDAQNTAMQDRAGGGSGGGAMPSGQAMAGDSTNPMQPQSQGEVPRPQGPMTSAVDASVGRAANPGFFPGN